MNNIKYANLLSLLNDNKTYLTIIKGQYIKLLSELTTCDDISDDLFYTNITKINQMGLIIVAYIGTVAKIEIIGTGTIIIEPKIIRSGFSVGHIEDIVVNSLYRGKGIMRSIIDLLKEFAIHENCYKIILNCSESTCSSNIYTSCGFKKNGIEMSLYF